MFIYRNSNPCKYNTINQYFTCIAKKYSKMKFSFVTKLAYRLNSATQHIIFQLFITYCFFENDFSESIKPHFRNPVILTDKTDLTIR